MCSLPYTLHKKALLKRRAIQLVTLLCHLLFAATEAGIQKLS